MPQRLSPDRAPTGTAGRWGQRALRIFGQPTTESLAVLPTGFAELDTALGIGGLPRGRMSELLSMPTSGKTTFALRTLAQAQALGDRAGYVDLPAIFDPEYAAWCGVDLADLLSFARAPPAMRST
jgi:recombination protein RecA